jgi:hypothetical protein
MVQHWGHSNWKSSLVSHGRAFLALLSLGWACCVVPPARAELQFDVFVGFDQLTREGNWFPISCEVFNDGPAFTGLVEISSGLTRGQSSRVVVVELPTNTRKRLIIPVFAASRYGNWRVRLLDERGKERADRPGLRPKTELPADTLLAGALPRVFAGVPAIPNIRANRPDLQPTVARLDVNFFPDNSVSLEALNAIYLNSEKALELRAPQVTALLAWLYAGGHLVLAVEQPNDVNATPWLRGLLPFELTGVKTFQQNGEVAEWLRATRDDADVLTPSPRVPPAGGKRPPRSLNENPFASLSEETEFDRGQLPIVTGEVRGGRSLLEAQGTPLLIQAERGRGRITVLAFSPEREPFRSWKHKGWFWAKVFEVPPKLFIQSDFVHRTGPGIDAVFGAMIDSRQVKKLPVFWLLLLLAVYLLVIGPFDRYLLNRLNRHMLTWITFPAYVVLFSGLIYWIGFLLRAGVLEWNELHVVDLLPRGERVEMRGRTFGSLYSPANDRYEMTSDADYSFATLRGEFGGNWYGGDEGGQPKIEQRGNGFRADLFVPVWVNQMYVSDWLRSEPAPLTATVTPTPKGQQVTVENKLDRPLKGVHVVVNQRVYALGDLPARKKQDFLAAPQEGTPLRDFVAQNGSRFMDAIQQRRSSFGGQQSGQLEVTPANVVAASFVQQMSGGQSQYNQYGNSGFMTPNGFELSALAERGDTIVLAWDEGGAPGKSMTKFAPKRSSKNTLLRLAVQPTQ